MKSYAYIATPLPGAVTFALVQQAAVIFLSLLVLDGGVMAQVCLYAFVAFWGGTGLLIARRGAAALSRLDLGLIRGGYVPVCIISFFLTHWIWSLRGY
jgi:hypothetical protein